VETDSIPLNIKDNFMKNILYILFLMTLSCNNHSNQTDKTTIEKNTLKDNSKYYTIQDTVVIATEIGDTLKYAKAKFNDIIEKHPEFFEEYPDDPDKAYFCSNFKDGYDFDCEVGRDEYYTLYAYFLKQRNGDEKFASQRQKLINIYSNINSLFGHLQYGGTYFEHQDSRILGYAEYSIYLISEIKIEKTYDITKQKELYIKSLRQLIEDESKIDFETLDKDKKSERKS